MSGTQNTEVPGCLKPDRDDIWVRNGTNPEQVM